VIDERMRKQSSINKTGHFQTDLMVWRRIKDSRRNPDKWAYYGFDADGQTAEAMPRAMDVMPAMMPMPLSNIRSCSLSTLEPVAKKFGVYNQLENSERRE